MTSTGTNDALAAFAERNRLILDERLQGRDLCRQLSLATDDWLRRIAETAHRAHRGQPPFALVAVGGYGRSELAPFSDIDVVLLHSGKAAAVEAFAADIWYPVWDSGLKLGHAVRTPDQQLELASSDLDSATALLSVRLLYGDEGLVEDVKRRADRQWAERGPQWRDELRDRVAQRERTAGDIAYVLEPDLKDGHGGLRDVQSIWWGEAAGLEVRPEDHERLRSSLEQLVEARVALHRVAGRPTEVLRLDQQDAVAAQLGCDADDLMARVAAAGRQVAWLSEEAWTDRQRMSGAKPTQIAPKVWLVGGAIELDDDAEIGSDPTTMLRVATAAARRGARIGRTTLDRLQAEVPQWPTRWPTGAVDKLVGLLLEGHAAVPVLESLDQHDLLGRMIPEWAPNRSRPQRNAYHRFTVDRHLWETAANAAELADQVNRPDLLVLGALFHDIGKGYPGDHSEIGMEMVADIGPRMGLNERDTEVLCKMVRHHLLLPDVASRRDISDPATIELVAQRVESAEVLELLHMLTIADSKATGPAAWSDWKEELVASLVNRVAHVVDGGDIDEVSWTLFPDERTLTMMAEGKSAIEVRGDDRVVAVYVDLPGALYRVAGALSLHGLDVIRASAYSDAAQLGKVAMAAAEFMVEVPDGGVPWDRVKPDLERSLVAQLAIDARLADRANTYRHRRPPLQAAAPAEPMVHFDDAASLDATVIEVRAPTRIGILYAITKALASTGCDVRHAKVHTVGSNAYDTFYVRNWNDELITDPAHRAEITKAVLFAASPA